MKLNPASSPECKRASLPLENLSADGTFSGYATLFGEIDLGNDRVEKGAFLRSLKRRSTKGVRMLFQHDPSEPIGVWEELREDARGLFVRGRILAASKKGAEVLDLIRGGAIDGLSIGFRTKKSRTDRKSGIRSILEADLWEISIVTFPMLPQARVEQVKGQTLANSLPSVREFERWLVEHARLSRSQARIVIKQGYAQLAGTRDAARLSSHALACRIKAAALRIRAQTPPTKRA